MIVESYFMTVFYNYGAWKIEYIYVFIDISKYYSYLL